MITFLLYNLMLLPVFMMLHLGIDEGSRYEQADKLINSALNNNYDN